MGACDDAEHEHDGREPEDWEDDPAECGVADFEGLLEQIGYGDWTNTVMAAKLASPPRNPASVPTSGGQVLLVLQALKQLVELPGFWECDEPEKKPVATIVRIGGDECA
ncbi:hypothetical protein ACRQ5Q_13615 [Bradyrhizobium sp. PMVTL-01]|uniref:hypothetical protein n=1 Tax=Bradyrhizobium sp. PMVTL-01 TaxID=3434999 RepID=UPI003F72174F